MARILVIDDEASIRTMVRRFLERLPHEIVEAGDGRAALEYLESNPVDLVISDVYLPDMDGIELTIRLRERGKKPQIIAMSGGGFMEKEQLLEMAQRLGAARTLEKPFTRDQLLDAVNSLLKEEE